MISGIFASVLEQDDRWIALAKGQLGVLEDVLQDYLAHGDSVLLANWIHIVHPLFRLCLGDNQYRAFSVLGILACISEFEIQMLFLDCSTTSVLCGTRLEARKECSPFLFYIFGPTHHLYIALHQGTEAAPTAFDPSTDDYTPVLNRPSS
jgi:hypothetical protein